MCGKESAHYFHMIDTIIFDFDGLIIDTEGCDYQVWNEFYQDHGLELPKELYAGCIGALDGEGIFNPFLDFEEKTGQAVLGSKFEQQRIKKIREFSYQLPLLPGVSETIQAIKERGLKAGLASSSNRDWVYPHLERLGIKDHFDTIKCREDAAEAKPAPDLYLAALQDLDSKPQQSLALEDSLVGATAAKEAGMYCVVISDFLNKDQIPLNLADLVLNSLADQPLAWILENIRHG